MLLLLGSATAAALAPPHTTDTDMASPAHVPALLADQMVIMGALGGVPATRCMSASSMQHHLLPQLEHMRSSH